MSGHFVFGANQLPIFVNLSRVLKYLETHYGLRIEGQNPTEGEE